MFGAFAAPTMISPSRSTFLFGGAEGTLETIKSKYQGSTLASHIADEELSSLGKDGLYNVYEIATKDSEDEPLEYAVMTPNVNPYIAVVMPQHPEKIFAIFEPKNAGFNGDCYWEFVGHTFSVAEYDAMVSAMKDGYNATQQDLAPYQITDRLIPKLIPDHGYFSFQECIGNNVSLTAPTLVWTEFLGDFQFNVTDALQYPWDTEEYKEEHFDEISAWNENCDWDEYVPTTPVWHQPTGGKCAMWSYLKEVDPINSRYRNGEAMHFSPFPNDHFISSDYYEFDAFFFYPILYVDRSKSGVFNKVQFSEDFPGLDGLESRSWFYKDYDSIRSRLDTTSEALSGSNTRYFGTPVWRVTFTDTPFQSSIDEDRYYFCAPAFDTAPITTLVGSTAQAYQTYYNRPQAKNDLIFWSEPKSNYSGSGLSGGYDVRVETFLSCAIDRESRIEGYPRAYFRYKSISFKSTAFDVTYTTTTAPRRGSSMFAQEVVAEGQEPKGGYATLNWFKNSYGPLTQYYIEDNDSFATQPILDGAYMSQGVFQLLEMKTKPT